MEGKSAGIIRHEVIRDLSVLYANGDCSEESRRLVEEHIRECEACRKYLQSMMADDCLLPQEEKDIQSEPEGIKNGTAAEKALLKNGLKKIRRRWIASVAAVACLLPAALLGLMVRNEIRGQGITFSNLDELALCRQYWKQICEDKFDQALEKQDMHSDFRSIRQVLESQDPDSGIWAGIDDYDAFAEEKSQIQAAWMRQYRELGYSLNVKNFSDAYRTPDGWHVSFLLEETAPDGSRTSFINGLFVTDSGLVQGGASVPGQINPGMKDDPVFLMLNIAYYWEKAHHGDLADYLEYLESVE